MPGLDFPVNLPKYYVDFQDYSLGKNMSSTGGGVWIFFALAQYVQRVNYQVGIWRRAHVPKPDIPDPAEGNGWQIVNGEIEPV